jgi:hypothetical protein
VIEGIDYYAGNGSPGLSGYGFAFIKATEGIHFNDPAYGRERARIYASGLVFGAYHFGHPEQDVAAEVAHFLDVARPRAGDVLFLDFEDENGNWNSLTNSQLTSWKNRWLSQVKAACPNNRVGLYCNVDAWKNRINDSEAGDFLFIAQYGPPAPSIRDPWLIWQYSDGGGTLDHDRAQFASVAAMRAWAAAGPDGRSGGSTGTTGEQQNTTEGDDDMQQVPSGFAYEGHSPSNPNAGSIIGAENTLVLTGEWGNGGASKRGTGYLSVAVGEGGPVRLRFAFNSDGSGGYGNVVVKDVATADGRVGIAALNHGGSVLIGRVKRDDADNSASATVPVTAVVVEGPRPL